MKWTSILLVIVAIMVILVLQDTNLFFSTVGFGKGDFKIKKECYEREDGFCSLWTPKLQSGDFFIDVSPPRFECKNQFPTLAEEGGIATCIGSRCPAGGTSYIEQIAPTTLSDGKVVTTHIVNTYPGKNLAEWSTTLNPDCWVVDVYTSEGSQEGLWIGDSFTTDCFSVIIDDDTSAQYKGGIPTSGTVTYWVDINDNCFNTSINERPQYLLLNERKVIPLSLQNSFSKSIEGGVEAIQSSKTFYKTPPHLLTESRLPAEIEIPFNSSTREEFEFKAKQFVKFRIDYPESTEEQDYPADIIIPWAENRWTVNSYRILTEEQFNPSDTLIPFEYGVYNEKIDTTLWEKIMKWLGEVF